LFQLHVLSGENVNFHLFEINGIVKANYVPLAANDWVYQHVDVHPRNICCMLHSGKFAAYLTECILVDVFIGPNYIVEKKLVAVFLAFETTRVHPADTVDRTHN